MEPGLELLRGQQGHGGHPRGLFTGGDATTQGGVSLGRIAFYDFNSVPASNGVETTITEPISGRVNPAARAVDGQGHRPGAERHAIARVELEVIDRENSRYLADNLTTWGTTANTINATLQSTGDPDRQLVGCR